VKALGRRGNVKMEVKEEDEQYGRRKRLKPKSPPLIMKNG
jgi:hypothetical protein